MGRLRAELDALLQWQANFCNSLGTVLGSHAERMDGLQRQQNELAGGMVELNKSIMEYLDMATAPTPSGPPGQLNGEAKQNGVVKAPPVNIVDDDAYREKLRQKIDANVGQPVRHGHGGEYSGLDAEE